MRGTHWRTRSGAGSCCREGRVVRVPELPEVEAKRRYIERTSLGRRIARVTVFDERILEDVSPRSLSRRLSGSEFEEVKRRAKFLLITTSADRTLLMHFGMTGDVLFDEGGREHPTSDRVDFEFADRSVLHFSDHRLFGRIALYDTVDESRVPDIAKLGPEPLDRSFTYKRFRDILARRNTTIHQVLMDQELIAGIGNIYSDEICYQAGVRPDRKPRDLSEAEGRKLFDKMKWTLRRAVELDADLEDHADVFLIPNRGKGGKCPHGHALESKTIGGRTSWFCPTDQK